MKNAVLIVTGILFVLLISGCAQTGQVVDVDTGTGDGVAKECPASCDDSNECTADLCDEKSDFECRNTPRWGVECGENGVCQDGLCVERTDNCSHLTGTNAESCYVAVYFSPAAAEGSTLLCDEISGEEMHTMCYATVGAKLDDPTICSGLEGDDTKDDCYLFYAEIKAEIFLFAGEACGMIKNAAKKAGCMNLEEVVTAPVSVKEFFAEPAGDKIFSYMILEDRKGRTAISAGTLNVLITQFNKDDDVEKLYSKKVEIKEEDFEISPPPPEELSLIISVKANQFEEPVTEEKGRIFVTFTTEDGKIFHKQKDLDFGFG